jgi:hypothetical protein
MQIDFSIVELIKAKDSQGLKYIRFAYLSGT